MLRYVLSAICLLAPVHSVFADVSWYLGAGGTYRNHVTSNFSQDSGLDGSLPGDETISTGEFRGSTIGWQVFGGLMVTKNFGFALKYSDSGTADDDWDGEISTLVDLGPPPVISQSDVKFDGKMSTSGFTAYVIQTLPISERSEFSLELGYTRQEMDFVWNPVLNPMPGFAGSISDNDSGFVVGGIFRYKLFKNFAVSGEIEYIDVDFGGVMESPIRASVNGEFHF